ncbi:hypothetical protein [Burkholderia sp. BDU5]|uniref:hypothetical protein n=1 Tax=Burkholderia sp. BDU5 TaxID=1385590 RepID=UPI000A5325FE|nr:hypothetical protein [Burkholderia sp. BDU5]
MTPAIYALVQDGKVINIIVWDGDTAKWQPPDGVLACLLPLDSTAGIDWTTDDNETYYPPSIG